MARFSTMLRLDGCTATAAVAASAASSYRRSASRAKPSASATVADRGSRLRARRRCSTACVPAPQRWLGRPEEAEQLHIIRRQGESLGVLLNGPRVVGGDQPMVIPERPVPHGILRVQRQRPLGGGARPVRHRWRWRAVAVQVRVGARQRRPRRHEARIECHRLLEVPDGLAQLSRTVAERALGLAFEVRVVRRQVPRRTVLEHLLLPAADRHVERLRHPAGDVRLHLEHVGERRVERLLPPGVGRGHVDQLGAHLHPARRAGRALLPAHLAHQQVVHAQLAPDLPRRLGGAPILRRAVRADDPHARQRRELAAHRVGDAVGEVGVGRVAQVLEREHGDPALVARRRSASRWLRRQANSTPPPISSPTTSAEAASGNRRRPGRGTAVVDAAAAVASAAGTGRSARRAVACPTRAPACSASRELPPSCRTGRPPSAPAPAASPAPRPRAPSRGPLARSAAPSR